jgi:hypothetical protein
VEDFGEGGDPSGGSFGEVSPPIFAGVASVLLFLSLDGSLFEETLRGNIIRGF